MAFLCGAHQNQENLTNGMPYGRGFHLDHIYAYHTYSGEKVIFELASITIAICLVLQEFQIDDKNSQDLTKSSNGTTSSYYSTVCSKWTQWQGHGSYTCPI